MWSIPSNAWTISQFFTCFASKTWYPVLVVLSLILVMPINARADDSAPTAAGFSTPDTTAQQNRIFLPTIFKPGVTLTIAPGLYDVGGCATVPIFDEDDVLAAKWFWCAESVEVLADGKILNRWQ